MNQSFQQKIDDVCISMWCIIHSVILLSAILIVPILFIIWVSSIIQDALPYKSPDKSTDFYNQLDWKADVSLDNYGNYNLEQNNYNVIAFEKYPSKSSIHIGYLTGALISLMSALYLMTFLW